MKFINISYTNTHKIIFFGGIIKMKFKMSKREIKNAHRKYNNKIILINENGKKIECESIPGIAINFYGKNNVVEISKPAKCFTNCNFELGDSCNIKIQKQKFWINNFNIYARYSDNINLEIGENCSINQANIEAQYCKNLLFKIGNDCMISGGILFRLHDSHTLYDLKSKLPVNNPTKGIILGDHCWIGQSVTILKDVEIAPNTIIGLGSIVTKSFKKPNTIIAGIPAKVVKENVNWDRQTTYSYEKSLNAELNK